MSATADLHDNLHDGDNIPLSVPYRCTTCDAVIWTCRRNPKCLGTTTAPHTPSATQRLDDREAPPQAFCLPVVIR